MQVKPKQPSSRDTKTTPSKRKIAVRSGIRAGITAGDDWETPLV
jgi:hypothetical protein